MRVTPETKEILLLIMQLRNKDRRNVSLRLAFIPSIHRDQCSSLIATRFARIDEIVLLLLTSLIVELAEIGDHVGTVLRIGQAWKHHLPFWR